MYMLKAVRTFTLNSYVLFHVCMSKKIVVPRNDNSTNISKYFNGISLIVSQPGSL